MIHPHEQLTAYIDGTLSQAEAADVAAHLAECVICRETIADLMAVHELLGRVSPPAPHPSLLPRTMARLTSARPRRMRAGRRLVIVAMAAASVALVLQVQLPPRMAPQARDWFFRSHAQMSAALHPMADVTLTSYLSTTLAYPSFEEPALEEPSGEPLR